jgi:hypothetical protein
LYCLSRSDRNTVVHHICLESGEDNQLAVLDSLAADTSWLLCINGWNLAQQFFSEVIGHDSEQLESHLFILGKETRRT